MKTDRSLRYFIYALFVYGWLSANIAMPILPELVKVFHTTNTYTKLSVTVFLLGFSLTQILWGPLSDKYGRRKILFCGFTTTVIGALGAALSVNVWMLIIFRLIESIGMGVGPVLGRSMIMDSFKGKKITEIIAMSAIIVGVMPALAPIIGAWLSSVFTWHSVFLFLVIYGIVLLIITLTKLHETNIEIDIKLSARNALQSYIKCFKHKQYTGSLLMYGLFFGLQLGYYTAAQFLFIITLHYSKQQYAHFMIFTVFGYIAGAYVAKKLVGKLSLASIVLLASSVSVTGLILLIILNATIGMRALTILLPMSIIIFGSGMISPAVNTLAMSVFKRNKGSAAALLGCAMSGFSALFSAALALSTARNLFPLIGMLAFAIIAAILVYFFILCPGIRQQSRLKP